MCVLLLLVDIGIRGVGCWLPSQQVLGTSKQPEPGERCAQPADAGFGAGCLSHAMSALCRRSCKR